MFKGPISSRKQSIIHTLSWNLAHFPHHSSCHHTIRGQFQTALPSTPQASGACDQISLIFLYPVLSQWLAHRVDSNVCVTVTRQEALPLVVISAATQEGPHRILGLV